MVIRVLSGLLVASVISVMWMQYQQLGTQKNLIQKYSEENESLQQGIDTMVNAYVTNNEKIEQVLMSQQRIQQNLNARQTEIRRLQNDVEEIRIWADVSLPDDIVRLRQRPTITGTKNYSSAVSASSAVHTDGIQPTDKR